MENLLRTGILLMVFCLFVSSVSAEPVIFWASADSGPNSGWEGSQTKGAAITIWGTGFGNSRGNSFITVAGVDLVDDADYAEWGAITNPSTANDLQRITFWLNSNMQEGNSDGIIVTLGTESNIYPFKIDNTGGIFFVSPTGTGDGTNIQNAGPGYGGYNDDFSDFLEGRHGGDFIYMLDGSYETNPWMGGGCCEKTDGTKDHRITLTSYPGQMAVINGTNSQPCYIKIFEDYWTIANIRFHSAYVTYGVGTDSCEPWDGTSGCPSEAPCPRQGNWLIGCEFSGDSGGFQAWGDERVVAANYIHFLPESSTDYPLYISEGDDSIYADNEIDGGADYIHVWDETGSRCKTPRVDNDRVIRRLVFERNIINMDMHGEHDYLSGLLIGVSTGSDDGSKVEDAIIRNNIFYNPDGTAGRGGIEIRSRNDGIKIYNNVFYNLPVGVRSYSSGSGTNNVEVRNNIFVDIELDVKNTFDLVSWITESNLYDNAPSLENTIDSLSVVGDPLFVNPSVGDFHVEDESPAIDSAVDVGLFNDFVLNLRPMDGDDDGTAEYDIGAYEYTGEYIPPEIICGDGSCYGENCTTCSDDCGECEAECVHDAEDEPCDGCVDASELLDFVNDWKSGPVDITDLMEAIGIWKDC